MYYKKTNIQKNKLVHNMIYFLYICSR